MVIKAINNTACPNGLVHICLIFRAYLCMLKFDSPTPTITHCAATIKNAMKEVQKVKGQKQVTNALN